MSAFRAAGLLRGRQLSVLVRGSCVISCSAMCRRYFIGMLLRKLIDVSTCEPLTTLRTEEELHDRLRILRISRLEQPAAYRGEQKYHRPARPHAPSVECQFAICEVRVRVAANVAFYTVRCALQTRVDGRELHPDDAVRRFVIKTQTEL